MKLSTIFFAALLLGFVSCESSEDISLSHDHTVPDCKTLTLKGGGQTKVIDDAVLAKELWGFIPTANLQAVTINTVTVPKGSTLQLSVVLSDKAGIKTAELAYSNWLYSKYINFANPEGDIPLTPLSYTFTADIEVPSTAVTVPWTETFTFNDGSTLLITQSYHKFTLTVVDVNMNRRIVPVYVKAE